MNLYLLVTILGVSYILQYIITKKLLNFFTLKEILVHIYIIASIILFIFLKNDFFTAIYKINLNYCYIIGLAILSAFVGLYELLAVKSKLNIGIIESLSYSIYLPIVALISYYFYNTKLSSKGLFGIILIAIGSYLITIK
tara:strand:+ start:149 stop:568 length:420 start_codon:yes stop_codon:yes gene_type:complete